MVRLPSSQCYFHVFNSVLVCNAHFPGPGSAVRSSAGVVTLRTLSVPSAGLWAPCGVVLAQPCREGEALFTPLPARAPYICIFCLPDGQHWLNSISLLFLCNGQYDPSHLDNPALKPLVWCPGLLMTQGHTS